MGYQNWVQSDWWALRSTSAARHGVDQAMPGNDGYFYEYRLAREISDARLDLMAQRVLRGMLSSGAFDSDTCTPGCDAAHRGCNHLMYEANATSAAHVALARRIGAESAVLLKNTANVLPLSPAATVALVGSACSRAHSIDVEREDWTAADYYVVGGSGRVVSDRAVSIRAGLEARGVRLRVSPTDSLDGALRAAAGSDVVLACGGAVTTESRDRPTLRLDQHALLSALSAAAGLPPLVVAVLAPGAVATAPWHEGAAAVATLFLGGQETGHAWADVLLGLDSLGRPFAPSGKLPVTFPREDADAVAPCPSSHIDCVYSERLHVGWRGLLHLDVAFPFGHGLSYTTFSCSALAVAQPARTVSVRVRNEGERAGAEVVQLYIRYPAAAGEPPLTLRGFEKTRVLAPGAEQAVRFELSERDLSIWDEGVGDSGAWRLVLGTFGVLVGTSSRDLPLEGELVVTGG